jgi:hypothetical protein
MATVNGNVKTFFTTNYVGRLTFEAVSVVSVSGDSIIFPGNQFCDPDSDGDFSVVLVEGNYRIRMASIYSHLIGVPAGDSAYDVEDLIVDAVTPLVAVSRAPLYIQNTGTLLRAIEPSIAALGIVKTPATGEVGKYIYDPDDTSTHDGSMVLRKSGKSISAGGSWLAFNW